MRSRHLSVHLFAMLWVPICGHDGQTLLLLRFHCDLPVRMGGSTNITFVSRTRPHARAERTYGLADHSVRYVTFRTVPDFKKKAEKADLWGDKF